ncbi:hypothetical protein [Haloechinothrix sp. LS1_15]|uniref:hypothetical protein n=1 Tax=Haloechinothrix sp. LS1_15 TaxID=2652248 RepID=UPI002947B0F1|nr:hypothetical protein [Haloechinothrix sp. LS1_15]MDV6012109.1 hypothetical protein [Haloechinothrix sp. LS1_15]
MGWLKRVLGDRIPEGFTGTLAGEEHVLSSAPATGGPVVATSLGLWVPEQAGFRRMAWHAISKVTWSESVLTVVESEEIEQAGNAVVIVDRRPVRYRLPRHGTLPKVVRDRVDGSIRSRYYKELPGGGAWFVQRKVPGQDGVLLQARPDPGTDRHVVVDIAREAAERLARELG